MKLAIFAVCLLGFMLLECHSSPIQLVENHELIEKARTLGGRQATTGDVAPAAGVAPAPADEDDDDDDDDDEPDLGDLVDDDDDDDEEEDDDDDDDDEDDDEEDDSPQGQAAPAATASDDDEEDDDDDDYLDRIFDDILGDDDDDDDDDEEPSSVAAVAAQPVQAAVAPVQQAASTVAEPQPAAAAASEILEEAASNASEAENTIVSAADEGTEGEQNVFYDESGIDTKVDIQSLNNKPLESTTAKVLAPAASVAANEIESSDDDDDDDEEDDITGALTGDDDDEDDDDTDDDDDDDDDIVGDDVIEARRSHGAEKNVVIEMSPDAFQDRHNQFIDAIFSRINRIVSTSYDPFKVRLTSSSKQATKSKTSSKKTVKKSKTKKTKTGVKARSTGTTDNNSITETNVTQSQSAEQKTLPAASKPNVQKNNTNKQSTSVEQRIVPLFTSGSKNKKKAAQPLRSTTTVHGNASKQTAPVKQKLKQSASGVAGASTEKLRRVEGTLSGLASLRRVGNAKVVTDPEGRNSTIKSKFTLGPLTLKVEKSSKRGNVRNVKTATARTNEMIGRIKFSVVNDQATLVSIKVQQPKQVEVESKDNHDRTREFVWRRTPKIARLVSEKLKLAAESLFRPTARVEVVRL